ncbi:MAG: nucleotidyltransferase family protein [Chitinophagaceae bacterium]
MKAMILAAGLGTRLKPFTDEHPKALATINGKSLLQRNIEYLASFGITYVIVNVHHFSEQITDLIKKNKGFGSNLTISDEKDEVLETGGGLMKARPFFQNNEPFVLMNVDILTDMDISKMMEQHNSSKVLATLAVTNRTTSRYFLFNELEALCGWRNIKTGDQKISRESPEYFQKAFSGIHIISPAIFPLIKMTGKFSMVDVYLQLCKTHTIMGFDHSTSKFIDVGKPESIAIAEEIFS